MDIKHFIMDSENYNGKYISVPINDKYNIVSDGEGGNRHIFVVRGEYDSYRANHYGAFVYHIWIDTHGILWATLYKGNQHNKHIEDIVFYAFAKNASRYTYHFEYKSFHQIENAIKDILLYAKN